MDCDKLPQYHEVDPNPDPPQYSPSVHHLSLVYYASESFSSKDKAPNYIPLLMEINSTQLNFYHVKNSYTKFVAHMFNSLHPDFVDPNLNLKSKSSSSSTSLTSLKNVFIGPGNGLSANSFSHPLINESDFSLNLASLSINPFAGCASASSSSLISLSPQKNVKQETKTNSIFRLFKSASSSSIFQPSSGSYPFKNIVLSKEEIESNNYRYVSKLLLHKPDINCILDTDYTSHDAQLLTLKSSLFKSYSLQELIKYGNAADFASKPFALRLIFPDEQFVVVSYTASVYASIFYKLNIARELSFDLDLRVPLPLDYCVPRRNRGRRRRRRSSTTTSVSSSRSTRTRSNSLINQNDVDDDDELDVSFVIDAPFNEYQPQPPIQPQIILEEEIFGDICDLEPAQQIVSSLSSSSRLTSDSVFSNTVGTPSSNSLSPISSENELIDSDCIPKEPPITNSHTKYKELITAIKCIRSCKNKTLPWTA